jgi:hypothetical protein
LEWELCVVLGLLHTSAISHTRVQLAIRGAVHAGKGHPAPRGCHEVCACMDSTGSSRRSFKSSKIYVRESLKDGLLHLHKRTNRCSILIDRISGPTQDSSLPNSVGTSLGQDRFFTLMTSTNTHAYDKINVENAPRVSHSLVFLKLTLSVSHWTRPGSSIFH